MKLDAMIKALRYDHIFGICVAGQIKVLHTVEFQKRGLPHAHIQLWVSLANKYKDAKRIDATVSAEIPDEATNPRLLQMVKQNHFHGPCGEKFPNAPCMKNGRCCKHFPKKYQAETVIGENGFVTYRRRDDGKFVPKSGVRLDNRWVVPYNKQLLLMFDAHINVEVCADGKSVKYLFKYIKKGHDRARARIHCGGEDADGLHDEITTFLNCRCITACESCWRIYEFPIQSRVPAVQRLQFHLHERQLVTYGQGVGLREVMERLDLQCTMFTRWMEMNQIDEDARRWTYTEFPTHYVWESGKKSGRRGSRVKP